MNTSAPVAGALPGRESVAGLVSPIQNASLCSTELTESRGAGVNNGGRNPGCRESGVGRHTLRSVSHSWFVTNPDILHHLTKDTGAESVHPLK